jgi:hypothetical protein
MDKLVELDEEGYLQLCNLILTTQGQPLPSDYTFIYQWHSQSRNNRGFRCDVALAHGNYNILNPCTAVIHDHGDDECLHVSGRPVLYVKKRREWNKGELAGVVYDCGISIFVRTRNGFHELAKTRGGVAKWDDHLLWLDIFPFALTTTPFSVALTFDPKQGIISLRTSSTAPDHMAQLTSGRGIDEVLTIHRNTLPAGLDPLILCALGKASLCMEAPVFFFFFFFLSHSLYHSLSLSLSIILSLYHSSYIYSFIGSQ